MTYTRTQAETSLVRRLKAKLELVGLSTVTDGTNPDLEDPLAAALRRMGKTASSPVSDTDLALLEAGEIDEFLDRAELRLLETIVGNIDLVDISVGPRRESLSQLSGQCEQAIARLSASIAREFGAGAEAGVLVLDFQQTNDEALL